MKKLFILTVTCIAFLCACNNKETKKTKEATDLSELPKSDTLKIDFKSHRDMLLILTIMPDSITTNWKWTKDERKELMATVEQNNYFVDTTLDNGIFTKFRNDYIKIQTSKGTYELAAYRVEDGHYAIVAKEKTNEKQYLRTYELFRLGAALVPENEVLGDYSQYFLNNPTDTACQKIFKDHSVFDYDLSEKGKLHVTLKEQVAGDNKDCLKGNSITLKFSEKIRPFVFEGIKWADQ